MANEQPPVHWPGGLRGFWNGVEQSGGGESAGLSAAESALDARALGFEVSVIENAWRAIDVDGSLQEGWEQMLKAGVIRA
jgi:nicotinamidase/pyrazinamidase